MAVGWIIAAFVMAITIIGLPRTRAAFNIASYKLLPFGQKAVSRAEYTGRHDIGTGPWRPHRNRGEAKQQGIDDADDGIDENRPPRCAALEPPRVSSGGPSRCLQPRGTPSPQRGVSSRTKLPTWLHVSA